MPEMRQGHYAKMCRSVPVKNNNSRVSSAFIINAVESNTRESDSLPRLPLVIGLGFVKSPQILSFIPDTGAEVTVAGERHMVLLGIKRKHLVAPSNTIRHVAGGNINVIGS